MLSSRQSSWPRDWAFVSYGSWIGRRVLYHQGHLGSPCLYLGECILGFSMLCHQPICLFFQWNATVLVTVLKYYKWFSVSPKVGLCQSSDFVFFLQCCVGYCGFLPLCKILESVCRYPPNNLQGLVLFWIWRSHWKELTSCQYRVFLFLDIEYCTIYLLWFLLSELYGFLYVGSVNILLDLYLDISFWKMLI